MGGEGAGKSQIDAGVLWLASKDTNGKKSAMLRRSVVCISACHMVRIESACMSLESRGKEDEQKHRHLNLKG